MNRTDIVVIGAGQAGLAMSHSLARLGIEHVVLERGRVAERWRSERWDSLRLLTPNWQSRLPGFRYEGPDPHGFMSMPEVIAFLERYSRVSAAPVVERTNVVNVSASDAGYHVVTDSSTWRSRAIVIATGYNDVAAVPRMAAGLAADIEQVVPSRYRSPDLLPDGGVLVVGASASGIQIADELRRAGRDVTIAVGHHTRVPRCYRGRDIMWWLDRAGILDESVSDVYDADVSREQPSFQLAGRADRPSHDLVSLKRLGARVVGRLAGANRHQVAFADDLVATTAAADVKLASLLQRLDDFAGRSDLDGRVGPREAFVPSWPSFVDTDTHLDLRAEGIRTVVWATGFRRSYPWLKLPVLDASGEIEHVGGITRVPGCVVIGLHFLRRRNSSFIDGVGRDAMALADYLAGSLGHVSRRPPGRAQRGGALGGEYETSFVPPRLCGGSFL